MSQIKISQLEEKATVDGNEMIPIQVEDLNYKVSIDTIINRSKEVLHSYKSYTYDELKQLKDSGLLIPGEHYLLTDYQCIYIQPVSEELITCEQDGWLIMLLALSNNEFAIDVQVFFTEDSTYISNGGIPIIECKYLFDNFSEYTWSDTSSKGVIIDLTDSNNNRCNYDFKHIKFRRWALKDVTENDTIGAENQPSCYRCYGTADEPKRSDGRTWVGSGLEIEKEYIRSIFDGTFNSVMWGQEALHEDYITKVHKPFKRTDENLQYIAYTTTLDEISNLTDAVPGLLKFDVDPNDYIDCYTFEYNGIDFSNKGVKHNVISSNNVKLLPNNVILVQSTLDWDGLKISSVIYNNFIHGHFNTFSIRDIYTKTIPYFNNNKLEDVRRCIFSVFRLYQVKFLKQSLESYFVGSMYDCTIELLISSVLFGYYTGVQMSHCKHNLLFGNEIAIANSSGNWVSPQDGNHWYDVVIQDWFGYNIMAPFQYSVFYPHTNTNTIKLPYNKGVTLMGTFQDNFIERMRWGVVVEYGGIQGNYMKEIVGCVVSPHAFSSQVNHSSGVSAIYKLEGATQMTTMCNTDVKGYSINVENLQNNLTEEQKTKLQERGNRKILFVENSVPYLKYYSELIQQ